MTIGSSSGSTSFQPPKGGPSFDCASARTRVDKAICASPSLAKDLQERSLPKNYLKAVQGKSLEGRNRDNAMQRKIGAGVVAVHAAVEFVFTIPWKPRSRARRHSAGESGTVLAKATRVERARAPRANRDRALATVPSWRHVSICGATVSVGSEVTVPRIFVRYRTDWLALSGGIPCWFESRPPQTASSRAMREVIRLSPVEPKTALPGIRGKGNRK
jgi:hypothetical protein